MRPLRLLLTRAALPLLALCALAGRAQAIQVTEFPLPVAQSVPLGIALGADGNIWFTEVSGSRFGRVTPAGTVTDFSTGSGISSDARPWGIAAGDDAGLWFTEESGNRVGRINPLTRQATEFTAGITSPSGPRGITAGPDGNVWFAEDGGRIGRITPAGVVTEFTTGITPGSRPLGITIGPDGNLWFTELQGGIGRITPAGAVTEFTAGITPNRFPQGITLGPDDNLWFTELTGGVGRITPAGVVTEFPLTAGAQPRGIVAGPDGNVWFTEENGRRLGRITPAGVVTEYPLALAAGGTPAEITAGPGRDLWFTTGSGNRIARARLDPAVTTGASVVTAARVTLAGSVDPFASSTSYAFEYGKTTAYGSATTSRIVPPGDAALPVSVPVDGLAPGTRYHYRIVASSAAGTSAGADRTFTAAGASGGGGSGPSGSRDLTGPSVRVAGGSVVLTAAGRVAISLRCPLAETLGCNGVVRLETVKRLASGTGPMAPRRVLRLGVAHFRIGGGQTRAVTIVVSRRGRALVRRLGRVPVRAVVTAADASGNRRIMRARLRLLVESHRKGG
jgi:streptogramin lyase